MSELEFIIDLHRNTHRQGPGSDADTIKALSFMNLPDDHPPVIADIGCGSGGPTLVLAQQTKGTVKAVDLFSEFLEELETKARKQQLAGQIKTFQTAMDALPFNSEECDVIWSEGAIYHIGFEKGIQQWREFIKPGGYLAVSEITWITDVRPKAIEEFWNAAYPEIDRAAAKIKLLEDNGYTLVGYFYLSPESWINTYYQPLEDRFPDFLKKHHDHELAMKVVKDYKEEIALYNTYKKYYSYGFYIAKKEG